MGKRGEKLSYFCPIYNLRGAKIGGGGGSQMFNGRIYTIFFIKCYINLLVFYTKTVSFKNNFLLCLLDR